MARVPRQFTHHHGVRKGTPLFIGCVGPSGSGKTKTALRLADGMKRVVGGKVFVADSENHRAEHYADEHDFEHVPFGAPFDPDSYVDVIRYCVANGAGVIVIDSMSHEHEGTGGVLEMWAAELEAMGGQNTKKFAAWIKPKAAHKRLVAEILRCPAQIIACFRAREKLEVKRGGDPVDLGYMPIGADDLVFEMHVNFVFQPGAKGKPTWGSALPGESRIAKLPGQFAAMLEKAPQLTEEHGEAMARWAAGGAPMRRSAPAAAPARRPPPASVAEHIARYATCDAAEMAELDEIRAREWKGLSADSKRAMKAACTAAAERIARAAAEHTSAPVDEPTLADFRRNPALPPGTPPAADGNEYRACSSCDALIEVPTTDPAGARCESCASGGGE